MRPVDKNRLGYKHTLLGWIPEQWEIRKLRDILKEAKLGGNYENAEANNGVPVIKMGNLGRGTMKIERIQYLPENEIYNEQDILKKGDLLFNTRNTLELVGKVALWKNELPFAVYNSNLMRMKFDEAFVASSWFMNYAFNSQYILNQLRGIATGTTSVAAIYSRDLETVKFALPSLPEQKVIARALFIWDEAIAKTHQLIARLQQRNKGLVQQLLTGKKRVKIFKEKWKKLHIIDVAKEVSLKNRDNKILTVMSCTKYDGLVPSLEYFGRRVFGSDTSTYKVVPLNHFAYATNHIEEGSIGYQNSFKEALISPMYTVFKTNNQVHDNFLYKLLKSHHYIHEYNKHMEGSIDRRGGLRWDAFSKIVVHLPEIDEQIAIASFLSYTEQEINLYEQKLTALQQQKKALMQKLLTGEIRVKI
jgi:type I restriction enzyme S subunit